MGKRGTCPSTFWKCCKVFLCISSYSKTLSRRIIYALFSQPVVGFWRLGPHSPTWAPSLDSAGGFRSQTPSLPTPGKNPAGAHALACFEVTSRREKRGEKERKEMD